MIKTEYLAKETVYPCLREYDSCGDNYVLLLTDSCTGMVVKSNMRAYPIGYYSSSWAGVFGSGYKPFIGKLVLFNE